MGCRELDIRDQFRFVEPGESVYARTRSFEKNRYKPVFHTVISNYRYYSPELGRWTSRDPIGEKGGDNLYNMVSNSPINWWDFLGWTEVTSITIVSYHPFHVEIKYEGLPECCEINVIQWVYDIGKEKWREDTRPSHDPFYYNYSQRDSAARWDKKNSTLHHMDLPSEVTVFIFIVVEVCVDCEGNKTATVLATRTWSSREGGWGFNGMTAHENEFKDVYEKMIKETSEKEREDMDIDEDGNYVEINKHKVTISTPPSKAGAN